MLRKRIQAHVEKATVTLSRMGGQGVLVTGNLIITAAHCIGFKTDGSMVLGDFFIEDIETAQGNFKVTPLAVEPVCDVAVLGSLDNQTFFNEAEQFEMFCEKTKPVRLCLQDFTPAQSFPVYIYTHKKTWVAGRATEWGKDAPALEIDADEPIEGGTSGGPVIDEAGELVSIVSNFSVGATGNKKSEGSGPRPHLALPVWVCRAILGKKFELLVRPARGSKAIRRSQAQATRALKRRAAG
jgi:hypothetical protein